MLKGFSRQFNAFVLPFVLFLSVLVGFPNMARADKAVSPVLFDPSTKAVNVATLYETTPTTQTEALSSLMKSSKSLYKKATGFNSFSIFKSEDGTRVLTLAQWQSPESYQAAIATPAKGAESAKEEKKSKVTVTPLKTVVFEIDKTQAPEGVIPAINGNATLVQFSDMVAKAPEDQPKVLAAAAELLTTATQTYPAPRSAVVMKGVDSTDVALLADWGYSSAELTDTSKLPKLSLSDEVAALTDSDMHVYEVVKVIAAKAKKDKSEKEE